MAAAGRTRVLIVDDSAVMRTLLRSVVATDPTLQVAGTAADGASALAAIALEHPDLVLLDVEMPVMDGLVTLRRLRERGHQMPVIMCSSLTQRGARVTIEALASGASDYVAKPSGQSGREQAMRALAQELIPKIHALTHAPDSAAAAIEPHRLPTFPAAQHTIPAPTPTPTPAPTPTSFLAPPAPQSLPPAVPSVVVVGVSTGGPAALDVLLPEFPSSFPLPVLVVQHMPEVFTRLFAERLAQPLPPSRARSLRRRARFAGSHLYRPRQLAHGDAGRRSPRRAGHPPPQPGPAREPLPPRRRRALSQRRQSLRQRRPRRRPYRHGLRRPCRRAHRSRPGRLRPCPGSGHQHRLGHARRRRPGRTRAQGAPSRRHRAGNPSHRRPRCRPPRPKPPTLARMVV